MALPMHDDSSRPARISEILPSERATSEAREAASGQSEPTDVDAANAASQSTEVDQTVASGPVDPATPGESPPSEVDQTVSDAYAVTDPAPFAQAPLDLSSGELVVDGFEVGGRYQIHRSLGAGGMAFVFDAYHTTLEKPVALKMLRPELASDAKHAQRFLREAKLASRLQHENIVSILDFGHDEDLNLPFLVMERVAGRSLAEVVEQEGPLDWERACALLVQLARALATAHAAGVVHRDVSPRNVLLTEQTGGREQVKLCDFGLSRLAAATAKVTATGQMLGTPAYAAPEQIRGDADQDHRVDAYAFGTVAFELLTGQLPFREQSIVMMLASKLNEQPPTITDPGLPATLISLVHRCLSPNASGRPAMQGVETQLLRLLSKSESDAASGESALPSDLVGTTIGPYEIMEQIGAGGVGVVYRGQHPLIGTQVAIKVLHREVSGSQAVARFVREARASGAVGSPHIPQYYDFGTLADGRAYAVMEYFEGETLNDRIEREGTLNIPTVAAILGPVASALERAHGAGIVHRDLKPDNIFLARTPDGEVVKLLDFGIAKMTEGFDRDVATTQTGNFLGTPLYCAPEQVFGGEATPQMDVYAIGATAFEMLTGEVPFLGTLQEIFELKTTQEAPSVHSHRPELPDFIAHAVARMLARSPDHRVKNMSEVRGLLASWHAPSASSHPPPSMASPPSAVEQVAGRRWPFALPLLGALLGVLGVVGAAVAFVSSRSAPSNSAPEVSEDLGRVGPPVSPKEVPEPLPRGLPAPDWETPLAKSSSRRGDRPTASEATSPAPMESARPVFADPFAEPSQPSSGRAPMRRVRLPNPFGGQP